MTTTVTVIGAATITSLMRGPSGVRETVEQTAAAVTEDREVRFPIHNTLSLRIDGDAVEVTVQASDWAVGVDYGNDVEHRVEAGETRDFSVSGTVEISELAHEPAAAEPEAA